MEIPKNECKGCQRRDEIIRELAEVNDQQRQIIERSESKVVKIAEHQIENQKTA